MSLWEKWEREKLRRMGVDVERKSDVEIHDTHPKKNTRKQILIIAGVVLACLVGVHIALAVNGMYSGRWADLFIVRLFAERAEQRLEQQERAGQQPPAP